MLTIGKHNDVDDSEFDGKELKRGIEIEMEHTNDPDTAKAIAKDHLSELPNYYTLLDEMEAKGKKMLEGTEKKAGIFSPKVVEPSRNKTPDRKEIMDIIKGKFLKNNAYILKFDPPALLEEELNGWYFLPEKTFKSLFSRDLPYLSHREGMKIVRAIITVVAKHKGLDLGRIQDQNLEHVEEKKVASILRKIAISLQ